MSDNETPWYYSDKVIPYDKGKLERYEEIYINYLRLTLDQIGSLVQGQMFMGTAGMSGEYAVVIMRDDPHMDPVSADVSRSDPLKPIKKDLSEPGALDNMGYVDPDTGQWVSLKGANISMFSIPGTFTAFSPPTPPTKTLQQIISDLKVRAYDHAHSAYHYEEYADSDIAEILEGIIADLERLEGGES